MNCPRCRKSLGSHEPYTKRLICECQSLKGRIRTTVSCLDYMWQVILWLSEHPDPHDYSRLKIYYYFNDSKREDYWKVALCDSNDEKILFETSGTLTMEDAWEKLHRYRKLIIFS